MKKIFTLVMVAFLILTLTASGSNQPVDVNDGPPETPVLELDGTEKPEESKVDEAPKYVFKAAHVLATDHPYHTGLVYFAEKLKEKSNGQIQVDVFPSGQLGGERDMIEGLQFGIIDFALVSAAPLANFSQDFYVFDLPYIFTDKETTYEVLDGEIGQGLMKKLEKEGIIGLDFWENGFFTIFTKNKVLKPEDMKGLTIRCMENALHQSLFKSVGANPVPMPFPEVYTALQNGTVDGGTSAIALIYTTKFNEVADYIAMTNQVYAAAPLLMSKIKWDKLPEDVQNLIQECSIEGRDFMRQELTDNEQSQKSELEKLGMEINDIDMEEWIKATEVVYKEFVPSKIPQELVDSIKEITYRNK